MSSLRQFMQDMLPERGVPPSVRQAAENGNEPRGASTGEPAARDGDRSQEKSILVQPADQRPRLDRASPPPAPTPPSQFDPPAVPERRQSDPAAAPRSTLAAPGAVTRPYLLSLPESGRSASAPPSVETAQYSKSQYSKSPYSNSQYSNSPGAPAIRPDDAPPQTWSTLSPSAYPSSYPLSSSPTPAAPSYAYSAPSYAYSAPSYSTPSPPPSLPAAPASRSPIALPGDRYVSPSPPAAAANYYTPSVYTPVGTTPPVGSTPQWPASYAPTTSYPPTNSYAPTNSYGARETVLQPAALDPADLRPALPSPAYPYGGSYSSNSSNVRLAPVTSACNVAPTSPAYLPGAPPYEVKRGLFNQLIVRVPGQPLRNFFRFVTP